MSTHNICFCQEIKKNRDTFWLKKVPYQELRQIFLHSLALNIRFHSPEIHLNFIVVLPEVEPAPCKL